MQQHAELIFRKATHNDIPFLIDTIVAAEKSGTNLFSYSTIFEMTESEIRNIFKNILTEDVQGQELCVSDYVVAEINGKTAGAVAAWIEGDTGQPGSIIKATLLNYFFPKENMLKAQAKRKVLEQIQFEPGKGTLVIDIGATDPAFRGQGLLGKMMLEQTRLLKESNPGVKISQTQVLKTNAVSYNICCKIGYTVKEEKNCNDTIVLQWLPSDTRIIMEKIL